MLLNVLPTVYGVRYKFETSLEALQAWYQDPELPDLASIEALTQKAETTDAMMAALSAPDYQLLYTEERGLRMLRDLYTGGLFTFTGGQGR